MKTRFALTVVAAALAAAAECRTTLSPRDVSDPAAEALYFVTNMQPYGQVAALPIAANGTIAGPGTLTQLGSNGPLSNQTLQNALSSSYAVQVIDNVSILPSPTFNCRTGPDGCLCSCSSPLAADPIRSTCSKFPAPTRPI